MNKYIVVFITAPSQKEARRLAGVLVKKRLAACVNIISGITSIYRWRGKVEEAREVLLVAKTTESLWGILAKEVKKEHPYDLPEIIALPVIKGIKPYLNWLKACVK